MNRNRQKAKQGKEQKQRGRLIRVKTWPECLYQYDNPRKPTHGQYIFQGQINGSRHTLALGTTDYAVARRELIKRRALLGDGNYSSVKISLADWCERYRRT